ncbi:MAG: MarR family winged helix-turn-helix transcriptional regulator [Rubrivivax sp.]|nr:MarR family winged helix-turn-helix transcriptional regulator [Rubrivivax sp.]MDP3614345.1 MarR family winged helix-turn-helix transcriptional regulator [Rubrivivax sp.]
MKANKPTAGSAAVRASGPSAAAAPRRNSADRPAATSRRRAPAKPSVGHLAEPVDSPTRVLRQFRIVFNAVKTHFQQVERKAGIGGAQVWALSIVADQPGIGVNRLAAAMSVRQPTASNLVRSLSEQGLVEVRREGADKRAVQLHVLPEGRKLLRRAPGPTAGVLPEALAGLDEATLQRLEADLSLLIVSLGADNSAASTPLAQL